LKRKKIATIWGVKTAPQGGEKAGGETKGAGKKLWRVKIGGRNARNGTDKDPPGTKGENTKNTNGSTQKQSWKEPI